jgi:hypothetical protein
LASNAREKSIRSGMTRGEARRQARLSVGGIDQVKEECREARGVQHLENLLHDLRYGWRMLVKKPVFTIVAVLTLALGVGANAAIFSIVDAVLLRSLPYRDPDRLVRIFFNEPGVGLRDVRFSKPELDDLQTRAGVFEDVTPIFEGSENLTGAGQPERLEGVNGSFSYFSMLGVTPQIGRLFGPQDFAPGFASEVVISDGLWHRAYGADPNVVGRTSGSTMIPYNYWGSATRISPSRTDGFRRRGSVLRRRIHCRSLSQADAWYTDSSKWNRTTEAWPDTGASSGAAHCHGCPITPRLSRRLPAAGAMDN